MDFSYTYDAAGNILTATKGGTTYSYTYGNSDWGDLLMAYNGAAIGYDQIGNPLSYYNGWSFTWQQGREMATATKGSQSLSFTYDADGIRRTKTVNGVTHTYYYVGGKLARETYGSNVLDFFYDQNGHPFMLVYNGTVYYYITNAQGDVIRLTDVKGQTAARYQYDPYGNIIDSAGSHVDINPLRYRGYYYDSESALYYLQSRYYDPNLGRFVNADAFATTGQGLVSNNVFTYCLNNPVNGADPFGTWTIGLSLGANITFGLGVSISIGLFFDDNGNFDVQWSYAVPGVDDTSTVGVLDAGVGVSLQYTDRDTVQDLYGPATYMGASGGPLWYVGADLISFSDASDSNGEINGFQLTGGIGVGVDVHVAETYTKSVLTQNQPQYKNQISQQRINFCYKMYDV